jgi:hypothetical protein
MRIAQVVLSAASEYERKSQRIDGASLAPDHDVVTMTLDEVRGSGAALAHVYAGRELPRAALAGFPLPYVSNAPVRNPRWAWRKAVEPRRVITPFEMPEAVEDMWFQPVAAPPSTPPRGQGEGRVIGTFVRGAVRPLIEQTIHRLERTRDDVRWRLFESPPLPIDLTGVDIWLDPAVDEGDYDGFVAEALVAGLPVVAARTPINALRLEKGRTGVLVPPGDPNEITHAILSVLFKPEVASSKVAAARQTISKFRARQRLRVLGHLYETLAK